jgi:AcrR family transcriptional regulator
MIELVATDGYASLTVRRLTSRARVSSSAFYSHYRSLDDCFLSTFDLLCRRASKRLVEASQDEPDLRRCLQLGVDQLLEDMVADPEMATFMFQAAPAAGPAFLDRLRTSAMRIADALEGCMPVESPHPLLLEGIVAALAWLARARVPGAGKDEIKAAAEEAGDWIMNISSVPVKELQAAAMKSARGKSLSVQGRLREGDWGATYGDEREMMLAAAFEIAKRGYHHLSIPQICREAGVSRRDFNRHFDSLEDCFVTALEKRASGAIDEAVRSRPTSATWSVAVYAVLKALCVAIETDREGARALFLDITAAGNQGLAGRDRLVAQVARALRATAPGGDAFTGLAAEASVAAAWAILRRRVLDRTSPVMGVLPILAVLILAPASSESPPLQATGSQPDGR